MRHAYLILAHNEWDLLRTLLSCIDDERNDIFVHIDAKVKTMPEISTKRASLYMIDKRIDVRWGDISVVMAEYALFEAASQKGPYEYYHLLSGVDLPIKSQDYIHDFFEKNKGKEFIGYTSTEMTPEVVRKVQRWHLFPGNFRDADFFTKLARHGFIAIQTIFGIKRNKDVDFKKGSQWVSITHDMVLFLLSYKEWVEHVFSHTFCADEIFVQTLCWMSPYRSNIYCTTNDAKGCMRAIGWRGACLYDWQAEDFGTLKNSYALFARKFNGKDWAFIEKISALAKQMD